MEQLPRPSKGSSNAVLHYTSIATQMGITIFLGVWGGMKLDQHFHFETPIMTLICSLLGVVLSVYMAIRDVLRKH